MTTREKLIELLEQNEEGFISGNRIAESLGISRTAIWKAIRQLENEGYSIEAVTSKGYRLSPHNDVLTADLIRSYLGELADLVTIDVHGSLTSTNSILKEKADTLPDWYALICGNQSAGRGRIGRSFFSPSETGVYLSLLLRPKIEASEAGKFTTAAAVAACRAIEACTDQKACIKWVNDVFVNEKKVSGILTEASVNFETGIPDWIVVGIGFNVYTPENGFPAEIADIAGAITDKRDKNLRSRLAAEFITSFYCLYSSLPGSDLLQEYRDRCFVTGKPVFVLRQEEKIPAEALEVTEDFGLKVRYEDGRIEVLSAGEVSIRPVSS